MWWTHQEKPAERKELTIRARLKKGDVLQLTFDHGNERRHVDIEGWGQVRLRIDSEEFVAAELVHPR